MEPVSVRADRGGMVKLLLLSSALVAASALMIAIGDPVRTVVGVLGVVFFGVGIVISLLSLSQLLRRGQVLTVDDDGYVDRSTLVAPGRVWWSEVRWVTVTTVDGQRMLTLEPADPAAIMARVSPLRRWLMRGNHGAGFEILNIPEQYLSMSLEELIELIRRHAPGLVVESTADGGQGFEQGVEGA